MKPLHLTIQAFGPFSGKEVVNFSKLGSNPLFLINGPTGAGKSSILDALCFALYGHTTGAERTGSQMRCDHAKLDTLTQVSLDFSIGQKSYRITRVPMQDRAKKSGEGTTPQQSEATLWEIDGSTNNRLIVSKKVSEADVEIKKLLGLNVEQFRQVMVLPQGKFRDLLLADSKDREKIFSQLFQTSLYKKIEEKLKLEASGIKKEVEQHQNQIKGIIKSSGLQFEEEVTSAINLISPQVIEAQDQKIKADQSLRKSENNLEAAKYLINQFSTLRHKKEEMTVQTLLAPEINKQSVKLSEAVEAQKMKHLYDDKQRLTTVLYNLKLQLKESTQRQINAEILLLSSSKLFNKAESSFVEVDIYKEKKSVLEQYKILLSDLNKAISEAQRIDKKATYSQTALALAKSKTQINKETLHTQEQEVHNLTELIKPLADSQVALERITHTVNKREQLNSLSIVLTQLKDKTVLLEADVNESLSVYSASHIKSKEVELAWHTGQAEILSKDLGKGQPCPVCGSLEHPKLAMASEDKLLVTKEDVDHARSIENQFKMNLDSCKLALASSSEQERLNKQQFDELAKQLGDVANDTLSAVILSKEHATQVVVALLKQEKQLLSLNDLMSKTKVEIAQSSEQVNNLEETAKRDSTHLVEAKSIVKQLEKQIPEIYRNVALVQSEIEILNASIAKLTDDLNMCRAAKLQAKSSFDKEESSKIFLQKQTSGEENSLSQSSEKWTETISLSQFDSEDNFLKAILPEHEQERITDRIEKYKSDVDKLMAVINQTTINLEGKEPPNIDALEQSKISASLLFKQSDERWQLLNERHNQLTAVSKMLIKAHEKNATLENKYRVIGTLYEVSNGLTGDKISLQRFVLSVLLDDVLIQASQRLSLMSKGRYQLIRKHDKAKGNKASGLELEVDDAYTGKTRPVATLSGGESFLAALSLALGVSDVVQSYAGGIKLDTLFIDEGFGSLDSDSLELAIRALIDLQSSGRMIGIISHVSEIKEQMGLRIDVKSGKFGSEISIKAE